MSSLSRKNIICFNASHIYWTKIAKYVSSMTFTCPYQLTLSMENHILSLIQSNRDGLLDPYWTIREICFRCYLRVMTITIQRIWWVRWIDHVPIDLARLTTSENNAHDSYKASGQIFFVWNAIGVSKNRSIHFWSQPRTAAIIWWLFIIQKYQWKIFLLDIEFICHTISNDGQDNRTTKIF